MPIVLKLSREELGLFGSLDRQMAVQVWFGILFCVNMQVRFLSASSGGTASYLRSVAPPHITPAQIFRSILPIIVIQLLVLMLILFAPQFTILFP